MPTSFSQFIKIGTQAVPMMAIARVDATDLPLGKVTVYLLNGDHLVAQGIDAVELIMQVKPTLVEGQRLRWGKHRWLVHNFLGHPLMQLLALIRCYRAAFWIHDATVPRPRLK